MDKCWQVTADGDLLAYRVELGEDQGTLTVQQFRDQYGPTWNAYHNGVLLTSEYTNVLEILDFCNQLADKLG